MCLLLFFGCLPTVFRPRGAVFTCGAWVYTCGAIASTAGVDLSIPPVAPADVPALFRPRVGDIYLRCYRHLPAVLKRAYPAGDVYLRWLLHRAWQDACHLENYLRCYRLHGGCRFEYTSGGSCGRACIIPPKSRGHLPPVVRDINLYK